MPRPDEVLPDVDSLVSASARVDSTERRASEASDSEQHTDMRQERHAGGRHRRFRRGVARQRNNKNKRRSKSLKHFLRRVRVRRRKDGGAFAFRPAFGMSQTNAALIGVALFFVITAVFNTGACLLAHAAHEARTTAREREKDVVAVEVPPSNYRFEFFRIGPMRWYPTYQPHRSNAEELDRAASTSSSSSPQPAAAGGATARTPRTTAAATSEGVGGIGVADREGEPEDELERLAAQQLSRRPDLRGQIVIPKRALPDAFEPAGVMVQVAQAGYIVCLPGSIFVFCVYLSLLVANGGGGSALSAPAVERADVSAKEQEAAVVQFLLNLLPLLLLVFDSVITEQRLRLTHAMYYWLFFVKCLSFVLCCFVFDLRAACDCCGSGGGAPVVAGAGRGRNGDGETVIANCRKGIFPPGCRAMTKDEEEAQNNYLHVEYYTAAAHGGESGSDAKLEKGGIGSSPFVPSPFNIPMGARASRHLQDVVVEGPEAALIGRGLASATYGDAYEEDEFKTMCSYFSGFYNWATPYMVLIYSLFLLLFVAPACLLVSWYADNYRRKSEWLRYGKQWNAEFLRYCQCDETFSATSKERLQEPATVTELVEGPPEFFVDSPTKLQKQPAATSKAESLRDFDPDRGHDDPEVIRTRNDSAAAGVVVEPDHENFSSSLASPPSHRRRQRTQSNTTITAATLPGEGLPRYPRRRILVSRHNFVSSSLQGQKMKKPPRPSDADLAQILDHGFLRSALSSLQATFRVGITNKDHLDCYSGSRFFPNPVCGNIVSFLCVRGVIFMAYNVAIFYSLAFDLTEDENHDHGWFTYLKHWMFLITSFYLMIALYVTHEAQTKLMECMKMKPI